VCKCVCVWCFVCTMSVLTQGTVHLKLIPSIRSVTRQTRDVRFLFTFASRTVAFFCCTREFSEFMQEIAINGLFLNDKLQLATVG
jgi:hypothetical protein